MKKVLTFVLIIFILLSFVSVFAVEEKNLAETNTTSNLVKEQRKQNAKLEETIERCKGNEGYGIALYILEGIAWYSLPVCFLGIAVRSNFSIRYWYKKIRL